MRSLREPPEQRIQPIRYRSDTNMAEILSKHAATKRFQVFHFMNALHFDEGHESLKEHGAEFFRSPIQAQGDVKKGEVRELQVSADYWRYLQRRVDQMERQWLEQNQEADGARFNNRRSAPTSGRI